MTIPIKARAINKSCMRILLVLRPAVLQLRSARAPTAQSAFPARKCRLVREACHIAPRTGECSAAHPPMNHRRDERNLEYNEKPAMAAEVAESSTTLVVDGIESARGFGSRFLGFAKGGNRNLKALTRQSSRKRNGCTAIAIPLSVMCRVASHQLPAHLLLESLLRADLRFCARHFMPSHAR